ncbi:MAG: anhydro-N-acetylmuramic acid kinase [Granulicella sp.]
MKNMIVAGVMSGTSADGVDVAICRITSAREEDDAPHVKLLGHASFPYPKAVRAAVLAAMDAKTISVAELSRLNWRLGEIYAECIEKTAAQLAAKPALAGCHGQTIYHQGAPAKYLGKRLRATWQMGEAAVVAERLHVPVVSDFRPADLAAGGQGAPLVPMLDLCMFRSARVSRVLQNLGGIANLTAIPAGGSSNSVMAFDTGPANMVIDHCMERLFGKSFDRNGSVARRGRMIQPVLEHLLHCSYFSAPPPKSCGREEFGAIFADNLIARCYQAGGSNADVVATATALTAQSILAAYQRFAGPHLAAAAPSAKVEYIVAGGGAKNAVLMQRLRDGLEALGVRVRPMEELGVPAQAKEAVAFALLAWLTWHHRAGNLPAATGADRPVILGKISHA